MSITHSKKVFVSPLVEIWYNDKTILVNLILLRSITACLRTARILDAILKEVADWNVVGLLCYLCVGADWKTVGVPEPYWVVRLSGWAYRPKGCSWWLRWKADRDCFWSFIDGVALILNLEISNARQKRTRVLQLNGFFSLASFVFSFVHSRLGWSSSLTFVFFALVNHDWLELPKAVEILCKPIADPSFLHNSPPFAIHPAQ